MTLKDTVSNKIHTYRERIWWTYSKNIYKEIDWRIFVYVHMIIQNLIFWNKIIWYMQHTILISNFEEKWLHMYLWYWYTITQWITCAFLYIIYASFFFKKWESRFRDMFLQHYIYNMVMLQIMCRQVKDAMRS